jgi:hypothetical protein
LKTENFQDFTLEQLLERVDPFGEPTKAKFIPQIPKVTPKFLRHFDLAIDAGGIPFTRKKDSIYHGFMRFKQPPASINDAHIITLIDVHPPRAYRPLSGLLQALLAVCETHNVLLWETVSYVTELCVCCIAGVWT